MEPKAETSQDAYRLIVFSGTSLPKEYLGYVYNRYLRSLKNGNFYYKICDSESYFRHQHMALESILKRPKVRIHLAVLVDNIDVVLGFAIKEEDMIHYVYVNSEQRRLGIGTTLCGLFDTVTHLTTTGAKIIERRPGIKIDYWGGFHAN